MRALVLAAAIAAVLASSVQPVSADRPRRTLAVVVARGSKVINISRTDLRRAYTGTPVSAGGGRLVPFNFGPNTAERTLFDRVVLSMSKEQAGRFWVDRKVRGESSAPRALPSAAHVVKVVAKFPGAISYLPVEDVTADLQVVAIDGKRPGEAGYPVVGE
jgi:hypothetical protein